MESKITVKNFLEMAARHALFNQIPEDFLRRGERKTLAIAVYSEGDVIDPKKFTICYEGNCVPLLPNKDLMGTNFDMSHSIVKRMAHDFLDNQLDEKETKNENSTGTA